MNQSKPQLGFGTCNLNEADVALFPFSYIQTRAEKRKVALLNIPSNERILGIANFPMQVPNRLKFFQQYGSTFHTKNQPLEFSVLTTTCNVDDYWNQLMHHVQKNNFPHMWIIAFEIVCMNIMANQVRNVGKFYYHDPLLQVVKNNFLLTETSERKIKTYPLDFQKTASYN